MRVDDVNYGYLEEELFDHDVQNAKSDFFSLIEHILCQQSSRVESDDNEVNRYKDAKLCVNTIDCALE